MRTQNLATINHNGKFLKPDELNIGHKNRAFLYGDGLFETIRLIRGKVHLIHEHYARLVEGMNYLHLKIPPHFTEQYLYDTIKELEWQNAMGDNARIRLTVYRKDGGFYTPESREMEYIFEITPLERDEFVLNVDALKIGIFPDSRKALGKLSRYKTLNALLFVMAGLYKEDQQWDECIILNSIDNVAEAISSNVFLVKDKKIYTPSLMEGCVAGVMRKYIITLADEVDYKVYSTEVSVKGLLQADEIFLTNCIDGVRSVTRYLNRDYDNKVASHFVELVNQNV